MELAGCGAHCSGRREGTAASCWRACWRHPGQRYPRSAHGEPWSHLRCGAGSLAQAAEGGRVFCSRLSGGSLVPLYPLYPQEYQKQVLPPGCHLEGGDSKQQGPDPYKGLEGGHAGHMDSALPSSQRHPGHPPAHAALPRSHLSFSLGVPLPPSRRLGGLCWQPA